MTLLVKTFPRHQGLQFGTDHYREMGRLFCHGLLHLATDAEELLAASSALQQNDENEESEDDEDDKDDDLVDAASATVTIGDDLVGVADAKAGANDDDLDNDSRWAHMATLWCSFVPGGTAVAFDRVVVVQLLHCCVNACVQNQASRQCPITHHWWWELHQNLLPVWLFLIEVEQQLTRALPLESYRLVLFLLKACRHVHGCAWLSDGNGSSVLWHWPLSTAIFFDLIETENAEKRVHIYLHLEVWKKSGMNGGSCGFTFG